MQTKTLRAQLIALFFVTIAALSSGCARDLRIRAAFVEPRDPTPVLGNRPDPNHEDALTIHAIVSVRRDQPLSVGDTFAAAINVGTSAAERSKYGGGNMTFTIEEGPIQVTDVDLGNLIGFNDPNVFHYRAVGIPGAIRCIENELAYSRTSGTSSDELMISLTTADMAGLQVVVKQGSVRRAGDEYYLHGADRLRYDCGSELQ